MLSSTVVYCLFAALQLGSRLRHSVRAPGIALLLLVIVGIGMSRLYLGVHWPSDLLGSLALALPVLASLFYEENALEPVISANTIVCSTMANTIRVTAIP